MIETKLVAALDPIAPERVFPDVAPHGTEPPWVAYQQYGGRDFSYMEQTRPETRSAAMQISVWSKSRSEATTLALQAEAALLATSMQVEPQGQLVSLYESDTGLRGAVMRFLITDDR